MVIFFFFLVAYHLLDVIILSSFPFLIRCWFLKTGFNVETVEYKNISFTVWDVGGQDKVGNFAAVCFFLFLCFFGLIYVFSYLNNLKRHLYREALLFVWYNYLNISCKGIGKKKKKITDIFLWLWLLCPWLVDRGCLAQVVLLLFFFSKKNIVKVCSGRSIYLIMHAVRLSCSIWFSFSYYEI